MSISYPDGRVPIRHENRSSLRSQEMRAIGSHVEYKMISDSWKPISPKNFALIFLGIYNKNKICC